MWKQILEAPNYSVNELGQIKNNTNGKLLKTYLDNIGYVIAKLTLKPYYSKPFKVHRLVAKYFVEGYFDGAVVNHINANGLDNYYKNLEWVTQRENVIKSYETSNLSQVRNFKHYILKFPNGDLSKEFKTFKKVIEYIVLNNLDVSYNSLNVYGKSRGFELIKY